LVNGLSYIRGSSWVVPTSAQALVRSLAVVRGPKTGPVGSPSPPDWRGSGTALPSARGAGQARDRDGLDVASGPGASASHPVAERGDHRLGPETIDPRGVSRRLVPFQYPTPPKSSLAGHGR